MLANPEVYGSDIVSKESRCIEDMCMAWEVPVSSRPDEVKGTCKLIEKK
jgi:hypothetical protein